MGSGGADGARTPDATSTTRRTLLELMAKMHLLSILCSLCRLGFGKGKCGELEDARTSVCSLCKDGIHVRVITERKVKSNQELRGK